MNDFPKDFLWGAASSSFQIEDGIENDFTVWERQGLFKNNGKDPVYSNGSNHWKQWKSDFDLIKEMRLNSYRFSVEWSRIEPQPGVFNQKAIDQYKQMTDYLLDLNIKPMLTLFHFSHPVWFHEKSPWHKADSIDRFLSFVSYVLKHLGSKIDLYVTLNEPLVWALAAYGEGVFPPGIKDFNKMMNAVYNMLAAHKEAYKLIKQHNKEAKTGIAKNMICFQPYDSFTLMDVLFTKFIDIFYNQMILNAFSQNRLKANIPFLVNFNKPLKLDDSIDFFGVNYYYRMYVKWKPALAAPFELLFENRDRNGISDIGWEIYPNGLYKMLKRASALGKDIFVTENGIAARDDKLRIRYLDRHLQIIRKSLKKGLPLKGYYHWSLLDNYEWLEGKDARFGLIKVDYEDNFKRSIKDSMKFYSKSTNGNS